MNDSVYKYFAYGSNMYSPRLRQRVPGAKAEWNASLPGYRLVFNKISRDGSAKANIEKAGSGLQAVHGVLILLNEAQLKMLDQAEACPAEYNRVEVSVEIPGRLVTAFTYVARRDFIGIGIHPYSWYKALILAGAREHGLPDSYIQSIEKTLTTSDREPEREKRMLSLLR